MKKAPFLLLLILGLSSLRVLAIDLGAGAAQDANEPQKVEVVNEDPIPVTISSTSKLLEITEGEQIEPGDDYKSPFFDVQDYRSASFYVIPEKVFNEPQPPIRYQLDAYFAVDTGITEYKKFGSDDAETVGGGGTQEFGMMNIGEEGSTEAPTFTKTTTGDTASRVLHTPIYDPYVRVVLRNLTQGERRKFKVVAFLSR